MRSKPMDHLFSEGNESSPLLFFKRVLAHAVGAVRAARCLQAFSSTDLQEVLHKAHQYFSWSLEVKNLERLSNVSREQPLVIVSNHPHGLADGYFLAAFWSQLQRSSLRIMGNKIAARVASSLSPWIITVDNQGPRGPQRKAHNRAALEEIQKFLDQGGDLICFPAGEVSFRITSKNVSDAPWALTPFSLAKMTGATVLPVHVTGHNSETFLRVRSVSRFLARLLLFRELLQSHGTQIRISVGHPISSVTDLSAQEIAMAARQQINEMNQEDPCH